MGRFWVEDSFVREAIQKYKLSPLAVVVYLILASHVDKRGLTFIGMRRIAELSNSSKSAVGRAMKELQAVPLVGQRKTKLSQIQILTVPLKGETVPLAVQKEVYKEYNKEDSSRGKYSRAKERIRAMLFKNPIGGVYERRLQGGS